MSTEIDVIMKHVSDYFRLVKVPVDIDLHTEVHHVDGTRFPKQLIRIRVPEIDAAKKEEVVKFLNGIEVSMNRGRQLFTVEWGCTVIPTENVGAGAGGMGRGKFAAQVIQQVEDYLKRAGVPATVRLYREYRDNILFPEYLIHIVFEPVEMQVKDRVMRFLHRCMPEGRAVDDLFVLTWKEDVDVGDVEGTEVKKSFDIAHELVDALMAEEYIADRDGYPVSREEYMAVIRPIAVMYAEYMIRLVTEAMGMEVSEVGD